MCQVLQSHGASAECDSATQLKMERITGEMLAFRQGLEREPLMLRRGKTVSIQLYIDMVHATVTILETAGKKTMLF